MFESDTKIQSGARVSVIDQGHDVKVGDALLGRVVDAMGTPLDGKPMGLLPEVWALEWEVSKPLAKSSEETS